MINNEIALNLVDTINCELNDPPTMTIEAAEAFFPLLEKLTGKKVALLARRVIFYTPGLPTKYHCTNDAHATLWHLVQHGQNSQKELAIKRDLNEETRKQAVWMQTNEGIKVFSLHITEDNEVIITDNHDYTKIFSIQSLDFYNMAGE